ncbi:MAG: hypothetical protein ACE5IL_03270 [Myxococcota bacterium]
MKITRRELLVGVGAASAWLAIPRLRARASDGWALPEVTRRALRASPFVYVSPLRSDGSESTCHAEVWYFWDGDAVVLSTSAKTWKARARASGLERARLWVGDRGRGQKGPSGSFREAPTFLARVTLDTDDAVFERLLSAYARRYPKEWGKWEPRFRSGRLDGTRVTLRYTPIGP